MAKEKQLPLPVQAIGEYMVVKQVMVKKETLIITDAAQDKKDQFKIYFEVVQKGEKCQSVIEIGQSPIFGEYVKFQGLSLLKKNNLGMESLIIVHENEVIAIDLEATPLVLPEPATAKDN